MGLFDKIAKMVGAPDTMEKEATNEAKNNAAQVCKDIVLLPTSHLVEETEYDGEDNQYLITFQVNDAFKEGKSHAAEVSMLNVYEPEEEHGEEGNMPYIGIQVDDEVYCTVEEFKESGTFEGAVELAPLGGKFLFKAKKEYYGDMMYFYGLDRCNGFWENNGLCMVYPKAYVGTENEAILMRVLDEAAESYKEEVVE